MILGKLICWLTGNHDWKRNRANLMKHCRRCGKVAAVKKRAVK